MYKVFKIENPNLIKGYCDMLIDSGYRYMISACDHDKKMEWKIEEQAINERISWICVTQNMLNLFLIWNEFEYKERINQEGMILVDNVFEINNVNQKEQK